MTWSDEESEQAWKAFEAAYSGTWDGDPMRDMLQTPMLAAMDRAVELAAARDEKTLTQAEVGQLRERAGAVLTGRVLARLAALGARVAVLEADLAKMERFRNEIANERDTLSQRLVEANQRAQENWEKQEREIERLRAELDALKPSGQVAEDREHVATALFEWTPTEDAGSAAIRAVDRLAALAQRAEAAQRNAAHWQARVEAAHDELAQVGPADGDLCTKIRALVAECDDLRLRLTGLEVAGAHLSAYADKTAGAGASDGPTAEEDRADSKWIEAMRMTCCQIVAEEFTTDGLVPSMLFRRIMERMEGAAP